MERSWSLRWSLPWVALFLACASPVPLEGRPCPCAEGWTCCESGQVCVRDGASCPTPACEPSTCAQLGLACGAADDGCGRELDCGACPVALTLRPASATSRTRGAVAFLASEPVDWTVVEGVEGGLVSAEGVYLAPPFPGTYHVRAQSQVRPEISVTAEVTVHASDAGVELLAGQFGGPGFRDGVGAQARFSRPAGVAVDGETVYVADSNNHALRTVDLQTGAVTTLLQGMETIPVPRHLALDGRGHLYALADPNGVLEVTLATAQTRWLFKDHPQVERPMALASDGEKLFVGSNSVYVVEVGTGAVEALSGAAGPLLSNARVGGLALSGDGRLFVADGVRLLVIDLATKEMRTLADPWAAPTGLVFDPGTGPGAEQLLYFANSGLRHFILSSGEDKPFAGTSAPAAADGIGLRARFFLPAALAVGSGGRLVVADSENCTLRQVALSTRVVTTVAGVPRALLQYGEGRGPPDPAAFETLQRGAVVIDPTNGIKAYVGDGRFIRRLHLGSTPSAELWRGSLSPSWVAGTRSGGLTEGELGQSVGFNLVSALTMAPDGRLFALDRLTVRMVDVRVPFVPVTLIAGDPLQAGSDDGPRGTARLEAYGMAWIGEERLLLANTQTHTLRQVSVPDGEVTTVMGETGTSGCQDGQGGAARFRAPYSIAWAGGTVAYVADGCGLRKVDVASWDVQTIAGSSVVPIRGARLSVDAKGRILLVSEWTPRLHRFDPATGESELLMGAEEGVGLLLGDPPGGLNNATGVAVTPDGAVVILDEGQRAVVRRTGL